MHYAKNDGFWVISEGKVSGTILGANLCTFNLLQGTEYFPGMEGAILFIEDDEESKPHHFDRDLQSLIHLPKFKYVKGIVICRFQNASGITEDLLNKIIKTKKELNNIPVIANADFGHTDPKITFPIGGVVEIMANKKQPLIKVLKH